MVPDDHTNSSANTLQYYINNTQRYFRSHTKFQFLPGKHLLEKSLIVNNVASFSIYGDTINNTTIYCYSPATMLFQSSKIITIKHLTIKNCSYYGLLTKSLNTLVLCNCSEVVILNSTIECHYQQCSLVLLDAKGSCNLTNIKSGQLLLVHRNTTSNVTTEISYYEQHGCCTKFNDTAIKIIIERHSQKIKFSLSHIKLTLDKPISIYCSTCKGGNSVTIKQLKLLGTIFSHHIVDIAMEGCSRKRKEKYYNNPLGNMINLIDCHFAKLSGTDAVIYVQADLLDDISRVHILNSSFRDIKSKLILQTDVIHVSPSYKFSSTAMYINNTTFSLINSSTAVILLTETHMQPQGPVLFTHIITDTIILPINSHVHIKYNIQFSYNIMRFGVVAHIILCSA